MTALNWQNNNPGNLIANNWTASLPGYTGANGRFATFDTVADGFNAANANLTSYANQGITMPADITAKWAPLGDGSNNPTAYTNLLGQYGVDTTSPLGSDSASRAQMLYAISGVEGGSTPYSAAQIQAMIDPTYSGSTATGGLPTASVSDGYAPNGLTSADPAFASSYSGVPIDNYTVASGSMNTAPFSSSQPANSDSQFGVYQLGDSSATGAVSFAYPQGFQPYLGSDFGLPGNNDPVLASSYTTPEQTYTLGDNASQSMSSYGGFGASAATPGAAPIDPYSSSNIAWQGEPLDNPNSTNPLTTANTDTSAYTLGGNGGSFAFPQGYGTPSTGSTQQDDAIAAGTGVAGGNPSGSGTGLTPDTTTPAASAASAGDWESGGVKAVTSGFNALTSGLGTAISGAINTATSAASNLTQGWFSNLGDWFIRGGFILFGAAIVILALIWVMWKDTMGTTNVNIEGTV